MDSTRTITIFTQRLQKKLVLEPYKHHKLENPISAVFYFKKHYQEVHTQTLLQDKIIRKENTLIVDSSVRTRTLTIAPLDKTLNSKPKEPTQEHLKVFKKNFQKHKLASKTQ